MILGDEIIFSNLSNTEIVTIHYKMETLLWIDAGVSQADKLVLNENVKRLPTSFKSADDLGLDKDTEYQLGLVYHQSLDFKYIPFDVDLNLFRDSSGEDASGYVSYPATEEDLQKYANFSHELIKLVKNYNIKVIDLLTCDSEPMQEIEGLTIRYSLDKTGNEVDESTNWILESHGIDVKDIYFSSTEGFTEVLFNNLANKQNAAGTGLLFERSLVVSGSNNIVVYTLTEDWSTPWDNTYFGDTNGKLTSNTTIDGNGKQITITSATSTATNNDGLFKTMNHNSNITIKNLRVYWQEQIDYGGIGGQSFGESYSGTKPLIQNCCVYGNERITLAAAAGGIVGPSSKCTIKNCIVDIRGLGHYSGGLFGKTAFSPEAHHCIISIRGLITNNSTNFRTGSVAAYITGACVISNILNISSLSGGSDNHNSFVDKWTGNITTDNDSNVQIHINNILSMTKTWGNIPAYGNSGSGLEKHLQLWAQRVYTTYYNAGVGSAVESENNIWKFAVEKAGTDNREMEFFLEHLAVVYSRWNVTGSSMIMPTLTLNTQEYNPFSIRGQASTTDGKVAWLQGGITYSDVTSFNLLTSETFSKKDQLFSSLAGISSTATEAVNAINVNAPLSTTLTHVAQYTSSIPNALAAYDDGTETDVKSRFVTYCNDNNLKWNQLFDNTFAVFITAQAVLPDSFVLDSNNEVNHTQVTSDQYIDILYELAYRGHMWKTYADPPAAITSESLTRTAFRTHDSVKDYQNFQSIPSHWNNQSELIDRKKEVLLLYAMTRCAFADLYFDIGLSS